MTDLRPAPWRRRTLGLLVGSAVLAAACGGPGPSRRDGRDDEVDLKRFAERGYAAAATSMPEAHHDAWLRGEEEIDITLLVPRGDAPSPLIVYLPGLGETAEAGEVWRKAWAQAGYAVAALQPRRSGSLWSSPAGRGGDFARVAREQFAMAALAGRIEDVGFVVNGILRRVEAAHGIYGRIDGRRIAVAGFDLGAQTALALAGERHPGLGPFTAIPSLRAVIALSPHANLARGGFVERFGGIGLPVLTVTAIEDVDPHGLVDTPFARQAPFSFMPPGDKFLLVLAQGTHRILAGANRAIDDAGDLSDPTPGQGGMDDGRRKPPGDRSRFGAGSGGPGGGPGGMGGMRGGGPPPGGMDVRRSSGAGSRRQAIIIERVSTAFLDAVIKDDPVAREWLARDASRWIEPLARLQAK